MNAPTLPATPIQQINIPMAMLEPSKNNPRKRFNEKKLEELAQSIRAQGVLQPLLVREIFWPRVNEWPFADALKVSADATATGRFEIIAGERRYRAAKLAGLEEIPCFVRNLTDQQVLHAQIIENLQRDDLHPLEEAEGYERLMQEKQADGSAYTAESIAAEIGKSKAYVYAKLKLLALCTEARQALYDDQLDASTALLIARIPVHKLQLQALKQVTRTVEYGTSNSVEGDKAMSYRRARDYIQDTFMLDLDRAPFDIKDALLVPKSGSCTDCQKRTGNQPELFDDVGSKDVCTDPSCHAIKKTAHVLAIQKEAESMGNVVIIGKAAKKLISNNWGSTDRQLEDSGYATLDTKAPGQDRTFGQLLKDANLIDAKGTDKPAVAKTIVENPYKAGQMIETVNIETAIKALREAGFDISKKSSAPAKSDKDVEKLQAQVKLENDYRARLFNALRAKIEADMTGPQAFVAPGLYSMLAELAFNNLYEDAAIIARMYWPDSGIEDDDELVETFKGRIPTLTTQQHFLMLIDLEMFHEISVGDWAVQHNNKPDAMLRVAKEIGIDPEVVKKEAVAEAKKTKQTKEKS